MTISSKYQEIYIKTNIEKGDINSVYELFSSVCLLALIMYYEPYSSEIPKDSYKKIQKEKKESNSLKNFYPKITKRILLKTK